MALEAEFSEIVVCADGGFALGAWITIWSAHRHARSGDRLRFSLITTDAGSASIRKIGRLAERWKILLKVVSADLAEIEALPTVERLPVFAYLRLLAPSLLPEIERFLYLDADVLVRAAVSPLQNVLGEGDVVAAVRDYCHETVGHRMGEAVRSPAEAVKPYFNTGVMVVHNRRWREGRMSERAMAYLAAPAIEVVHGDQDGLNAIFRDEVRELEPRWNVQLGAIEFFDRVGWPEGDRTGLKAQRKALLGDAAIAHFIGPAKPWNCGFRVPYGAEYRAAIVDSGWVPRWFAPIWLGGWAFRAIRHSVAGRWRAVVTKIRA